MRSLEYFGDDDVVYLSQTLERARLMKFIHYMYTDGMVVCLSLIIVFINYAQAFLEVQSVSWSIAMIIMIYVQVIEPVEVQGLMSWYLCDTAGL